MNFLDACRPVTELAATADGKPQPVKGYGKAPQDSNPLRAQQRTAVLLLSAQGPDSFLLRSMYVALTPVCPVSLLHLPFVPRPSLLYSSALLCL